MLEVSLRTYIGLSRDNWALQLNTLPFSYNSTSHSAMSFISIYLVHGHPPVTECTILHCLESIPRLSEPPLNSELCCKIIIGNITDNVSLYPQAQKMIGPLSTEQPRAFKLRLFFQKRAHYQDQSSHEFQEGNL